MTYFKVIQNKKVVTVGCVFLKWNMKRQKLFICDANEGQFVQSYDELHVYHDSWLKPSMAHDIEYEEATIVVITEQEYEDLLESLDEGEVVEESPVIEEEPVEVQIPEEEKPMSIAEMREIIARQQEQINMLINKLS